MSLPNTLVDGGTFLVCGPAGDVAPGDPTQTHGLFFDDCRHLSALVLTVDGAGLTPLETVVDSFRASTDYAVGPRGSHGAGLVVRRRRHLRAGEGLRDEVQVANHGLVDRAVELVVSADADFADIFEVRGAPAPGGARERRTEPDGLTFRYVSGPFRRCTAVRADRPVDATPDGFRLTLPVPAGGAATVVLTVAVGTETAAAGPGAPYADAIAEDRADLAAWSAGAAATASPTRADRAATRQRSLDDLRALCVVPALAPHAGRVPAAGLPWFMTLFGRDSLLTSYLALAELPELARGTLRALAALQGSTDDPAREEQPGKILHECRVGELALSGAVPFGRYYGTVDATPLFVVVLDAYVAATGDAALARELEPAARAALAWLTDYGDVDGDGFVEYAPRNPAGLVHQCWKDSPDSIRFADGREATGPIAVCEAQGYAYDALRRGARLARDVWGDPAYAAGLTEAADALRERFDAAFWCPERSFYALALDGAKQRVDSRTSNVGHLLWSGIVPPHRVAPVVDALLSPELFSGWGVRTLASDEAAYNPVSYHRGSVWPHDSAIVALGLAAAGAADAAETVAAGVLDAAPAFGHRLPELMAGFPAADTGRPLPYPTACSPQAWAAAAPLAMLRIENGQWDL